MPGPSIDEILQQGYAQRELSRELCLGNAVSRSPVADSPSAFLFQAAAFAAQGDYVYLSDGGHFENLGIYKLVRCRCKLIVASDASCDSAYGFTDLYNVMERCRSDFGIEITITADETGWITPVGQPPSASAHFAIGTIHYTPGNSHDEEVLIKPAPVAADAADILGYSASNASFPNDTTANQWFDESHFENYRATGEATGRGALETIDAAIRRALHK